MGCRTPITEHGHSAQLEMVKLVVVWKGDLPRYLRPYRKRMVEPSFRVMA